MVMVDNGTPSQAMAARPDTDAAPASGLRVYNSLTRRKELFQTGNGSRTVSWYICGPTVYDSSHLGHARNYLTFDIIRRVLEDYFGYSVFYVMNVTDVDDKIIKRARRNFLLEQYRSRLSDPCKVAEKLEQVFTAEIGQQQKEVQLAGSDVDRAESVKQKDELQEKLKQEQLKLSKLEQAHAAMKTQTLVAISLGGKEGVDLLIADAAADALASQLDAQDGANVTDLSIYRSHAAMYEKEFFEDMAALGVRYPDILTRVTEYISVIIDYVRKIESKNFAYAANGSVYFDTTEFEKAGHKYGKLNPWAVGHSGLASESEQNFENQEKRSKCDFALWKASKASKAGEPVWDSPWGPGRPGWHIECSAMASDIIGQTIDIHSGGVDLQFPHHTNEVAQAEAYYGCHEWVKYFLHSGHLSIEGLKMSKSLKNFITIKEALKKYTPRQLRLLFIIQSWDKPMSFSDAVLNEALGKERQLKNFFANVNVIIKQGLDGVECWEEDEKEFFRDYQEAELQVRNRLEDNFDTAGSLIAILNLVKSAHLYIEKKTLKEKAEGPRVLLVAKVAAFVTKMLVIFGLSDARGGEIGFGQTSRIESLVTPYLDTFVAFRERIRAASRAGSGNDIILGLVNEAQDYDLQDLGRSDAQDLGPYVDALVRFKNQIRAAATGDGASKGKILDITDRVRDETLGSLGVRLEDGPLGSVWFFDDVNALKDELQKAVEAKIKKMEEKRDKLLKDLEKWESVPLPQSVFKNRKEFTSLDDKGIPTHDSSGKDLSKQARKKVEKEMRNAVDLHEKLRLKMASEPGFLINLKQEAMNLEMKIGELKMGKE